MTCEKLETLWAPYLDRNLAASERAMVEAHLAECSACQARRDGFLAVSRELDRWEAPAPSPWFEARLQRRIDAESLPGRGGWWAVRSPAFPLSIAAMLLLAALLIWSGGANRPLAPQRVFKDADRMEELIHVADEVELLSDAEFLTELKKPASAERRIDR